MRVSQIPLIPVVSGNGCCCVFSFSVKQEERGKKSPGERESSLAVIQWERGHP